MNKIQPKTSVKMNCPFNEEQLTQLKAFVELCKNQPMILHHPKLSFFKDYLVSLGVTLPTATYNTKNFTASGDSNAGAKVEEEVPAEEEEEDIESDVELDMEGVITDSTPADQEMGDETKEVSDEDRDLSDEKRSEAMRAFSEQKYDEAIQIYTEAIKLNPQSALLFAKRGQVFLKQNRLHACIKDCSRALELNCDSVAGYKFRGRAYRLLGKFEEAAHDLCESLKIDYDDQTNEWLNEVKPNADKIRQHNINVQRHREEKERREKLNRARKAQKANAEAAEEQAFSQGFPKFMGKIDLEQLLKDPELLAASQDLEILMALQDISSNPINFLKYQNNPKIAAALELFARKYKCESGATPEPQADTKPKPANKTPDDDVGLD
ncbi:unnamed protein product [Danaus chrysippus]|uniref:(African queen) hypothetical protein n=1 Tax=Danaus chrysippus TaxID=151541 RepID=A0A8J2W419_9NEOP|nr:unnamed protein product [Danaus chrysippus]